MVYDYHSAGYRFDYQSNDLPVEKRFTYAYESDDVVYDIMTSINCISAKLYNREFITKHNARFDESIRIGEDTLFVFGLALEARGMYKIDGSVYYYRQDFDNNYSATGTINAVKVLDFVKALAEMEKIVKQRKLDKDEKFVRQFRRGVVAHVIYNMSLAERDPIAHKKLFDAIHDEVVNTYHLDASLAKDGTERDQLELIIKGDYAAYTLVRLNQYKTQLYGLIDEKHSGGIKGLPTSFARKLAHKVAPYVPPRQRRFIKRALRAVRRRVNLLR